MALLDSVFVMGMDLFFADTHPFSWLVVLPKGIFVMGIGLFFTNTHPFGGPATLMIFLLLLIVMTNA